MTVAGTIRGERGREGEEGRWLRRWKIKREGRKEREKSTPLVECVKEEKRKFWKVGGKGMDKRQGMKG